MRTPITSMEQLMPFPTAQELIKKRNEPIASIPPNITVLEAMKLMAEKNIRFMPVIEKGMLCGVLSERDCARKIIIGQMSADQTQVRDIMSIDINSVTPESKIPECLMSMYDKDVGYLSVISGKEVIGILSIRELMGALIERHERLLRKLADERLTMLYTSSGNY